MTFVVEGFDGEHKYAPHLAHKNTLEDTLDSAIDHETNPDSTKNKFQQHLHSENMMEEHHEHTMDQRQEQRLNRETNRRLNRDTGPTQTDIEQNKKLSDIDARVKNLEGRARVNHTSESFQGSVVEGFDVAEEVHHFISPAKGDATLFIIFCIFCIVIYFMFNRCRK